MGLEKAHYTIDRYGMWQMLRVYGDGGKLLKALQSFFVNSLFFYSSEQLWLFNGQVVDSTAGDYFFYPLTGAEHGSQPCLTTRDRELVSVIGRVFGWEMM